MSWCIQRYISHSQLVLAVDPQGMLRHEIESMDLQAILGASIEGFNIGDREATFVRVDGDNTVIRQEFSTGHRYGEPPRKLRQR